MERVMAQVDLNAKTAHEVTVKELQRVAPVCRWTAGTWEELGLPWNEMQNTPRHISNLSNFLIRQYVSGRAASR